MGTPVATPVYPTVLKLPGQIPALQHRGSWTQQRRHPPYHHHLPAFSLSLSLSLSHSLSLSLSLSLFTVWERDRPHKHKHINTHTHILKRTRLPTITNWKCG